MSEQCIWANVYIINGILQTVAQWTWDTVHSYSSVDGHAEWRREDGNNYYLAHFNCIRQSMVTHSS